MESIKVFISTFLFCICLDMLWLAVIAKNIYDNQIGFLLRKTGTVLTPHLGGAFCVYIAITIGIFFFTLPKTENNFTLAIFYGALFGSVIYGVYDFTNYSILARWPLKITLIDLCWGMFLCSTTTCFSLIMKRWIEN